MTSIFINQQNLVNDFKEQKRFLSELRFRDSLDLVDKNRQIKILEKKNIIVKNTKAKFVCSLTIQLNNKKSITVQGEIFRKVKCFVIIFFTHFYS